MADDKEVDGGMIGPFEEVAVLMLLPLLLLLLLLPFDDDKAMKEGFIESTSQ